MKVIVEKEEAEKVSFDPNKDYPVLRNFVQSDILGFAKVTLHNVIMYADLNLKENVNGYPAIGYIRVNETDVCHLEAISICNSPNSDESIEPIEYIFQLEGKPSNLKTK